MSRRDGAVRAPGSSAFRRYLAGQAVSNVGTWMHRTAQGWLVLRLTHDSGHALGIVVALQFLPQTLFGLYGGALADRRPKRRLLLVTQTSMSLQALVLGILTMAGSVHLWHVYGLAFALGAATALDGPARHAFIGELVGRDGIPRAVSLNAAQFNAARLLGPGLAGVLIAAAGTGPVFLLNAASYLTVVGVLATLRRYDEPPAPGTERRTTRMSVALRHVRTDPDLLVPITAAAVVGTAGLNFQVTIPMAAKAVFHSDATAFGALTTAYAAGGLLGALLGARRRGPVTAPVLLGRVAAFGLLEAAVGVMPTYGTFMALLVPTGLAAVLVTTAANAMTQCHAPPVMRGRIMSLYLLVLLGGTPLGAPLAGWTAQALGARYSLILGGLTCLAAAAALAVAPFGRARGRGVPWPGSRERRDGRPAVAGRRRPPRHIAP
ncbi:MFS transporter [Streptomyces luteireticuli]|uniref:MFS transporter n=1 Tax=Streptomyces luteireticuli TaxID=173858 RepID=A0ABN0YXN3_9ACTN